ncbi:MAG: amidase [Chloroflexi bacterium]|nr:amidase [Chloroflexota bacterium]
MSEQVKPGQGSGATTADVCALGVAELAEAYRKGRLSPVEVTRATLERIDALNPKINAFRTVLHESALAAAEAAERQLRAGIDLGPLHGVPVSVKDIIRVKGTVTTAGSPVLMDAPPDEEDASVTTRLRQAGAVLVGKVNLHEFATGGPDPNGPFGLVKNPRKVGYQPGSSSSGSGSATAAGLGVISLGTDTGGSVRNPAALCGTVGIKATYGRVPVHGVIALSVNLDHVGPLARSVYDTAAGLQAIAGHERRDPYSAAVPTDDYLGAIGRDINGLRVGVPTNALYRQVHPEVREVHEQALKMLESVGFDLVEVDLPDADDVEALFVRINQGDSAAYHERFRDREHLYGADAAKRIFPGRERSAIDYVTAREAQAEFRRNWLAVFERVDLLVHGVNPICAPKHGVTDVDVNGKSHYVRSLLGYFNRAANLTGLPAIAIPAGLGPNGLPVAIQLTAPHFKEARLFAAGYAFEQALGLAPKLGIDVVD